MNRCGIVIVRLWGTYFYYINKKALMKRYSKFHHFIENCIWNICKMPAILATPWKQTNYQIIVCSVKQHALQRVKHSSYEKGNCCFGLFCWNSLDKNWSYGKIYSIAEQSLCVTICWYSWWRHQMETYFRVTGHLCGECTGQWWIPLTKASDAELWYFLWSTVE